VLSERLSNGTVMGRPFSKDGENRNAPRIWWGNVMHLEDVSLCGKIVLTCMSQEIMLGLGVD
jgi:hypothetical protein